MYMESRRVFISDLPEELTSGDVTKRFSKYGPVSSVEIKERKDLGSKNNSRFFAFVNIEIDAESLQKCFHEISSEKWKGQYVQLQLARENFLDRLKKEREEAKESQPPPCKIAEPLPLNFNIQNISEHPKIKSRANKAPIQSNTDSSDSEDEKKSTSQLNKHIVEYTNGLIDTEKGDECVEELPDIVYKSNKSKIVNNKLVIESVGNKPIFISTTIKSKSLDPKRTEADQKRLQSLLEKRQGFNKQKFLIKSALAKIDVAPSVYDNSIDNISKTSAKSSKKPMLFENDDADEEAFNFNLKKQYEGVKGQRLLALQSNYRNDDRFMLDERFIEEEHLGEDENNVKHDLLGEKKKEYEIMEEVLGSNVAPNIERQKNKLMLRFDPNQPEHSKYEIKDDVEPTKKRKKEKVEVVLPEVSQETFFNVDDTLKDALQEKSSFSLLGMFGETSNTLVEDNTEPSIKIQKKNSLIHTENPFKYDSSDDEYQPETIENIANKDSRKEAKKTSATVSLGAKRLWTESLFFKEDDYRFQDGMEFVIKLGTEEICGISEVREEIKQIVRAKVRNNKGKDKMFKKKLGGQKFKFRRGQKRH